MDNTKRIPLRHKHVPPGWHLWLYEVRRLHDKRLVAYVVSDRCCGAQGEVGCEQWFAADEAVEAMNHFTLTHANMVGGDSGRSVRRSRNAAGV